MAALAWVVLAGCGSRSGLLEGSATGVDGGGSGGGGGGGGAGGSGGAGGIGGVSAECAHAEPTELVNGVIDAHAIAVDETHVYFTLARDGGVAMRVSKLGGAAEVIATGLGRPRHLALWGDDVYVTSPMTGDVVRARKDGTGQTEIFDGLPHPEGIAAGEHGIAWLRSSANAGELWSLPWGGMPVVLAAELPSPYAIALSGEDAYFVDNGSGKAAPSVRHLSLATAAQSVLSELPAANAHAVAVDEAWVYVTLNAEVRRVRRDAAVSEKLGEGVFLRGITLAGDRVYWAERGAAGSTGRVVRRWLTSDVLEVVAEDDAHPQGVANDGTCLYWTSAGGLGKDGSVHAAPL